MTKLFSTAYFVGSWSNNWSLWGDNIGFGMGSKMGRCPPTSCCLHEGRQGVLWLHWCMFIDWKKFFLYGYAKLAILIIDCLWVAGNCWGRYLCLWWPLPNHGSLWFCEWQTLLVGQELLGHDMGRRWLHSYYSPRSQPCVWPIWHNPAHYISCETDMECIMLRDVRRGNGHEAQEAIQAQ